MRLHSILIASAVLVSIPVLAGEPDPKCVAAQGQTPKTLNWSDGKFRICSPINDRSGKAYAPETEMVCTVYIDGLTVASRLVHPGKVMEGPHNRTGVGVATAVCMTVADQLSSEPASPAHVNLGRTR
jgi:hypothetical protein